MADVLSQSEIDALLNAISTGEMDVDATTEDAETNRVKSYDFRTANRFSKEQMRTISLIYDNFARLFSTYLSGTLRAMCQVDVLSVEELKYVEFVNSMPTPVVLAIAKMPPLVGPTLLEISPDVAYSLISRLLGGTGDPGTHGRVFTEIELVLIERVVRQFIGLLSEAWEKVISIHVSLDRIETSAQFAQIVALNETVAIITLNVKIGGSEGLMNLCLPHLALEPISKQLNTKVLFQTGSEHRERAPATEDIRQRIVTTPLTLKAAFNDTGARVQDILSLQVGDVIQLDHKVGEPLTVQVGHLSKFKAALGTRENKYAVMISDLIREEETGNE